MRTHAQRCPKCLSLCAGLVLTGGGLAHAETIYFKNGKRIEAKITQRTEKAVVVDWFGAPVTYWLDDIERIDESTLVQEPRVIDAQPTAPTPSVATPATEETSEAGPPQDAERVALVDHVLTLSHISKETFERIVATQKQQLDQVINQQTSKLSSSVSREKFRQTMQEALNADLFYTAMRNAFLQQFDRQKLEAVQTWLSSPLAQRMYQLGQEAFQDREAMRQFGEQLPQHPPSPTRIVLIQRLARATGAAHMLADTLQQGQLAMAGEAGIAPDQAPAFPTITMNLGGHNTTVDLQKMTENPQAAEAYAWLGLVFMYRSVPDEELEQYVTFQESEAWQWYLKLTKEAFAYAMGQSMKHLMAISKSVVNEIVEEEMKSRKKASDSAQPNDTSNAESQDGQNAP